MNGAVALQAAHLVDEDQAKKVELHIVRSLLDFIRIANILLTANQQWIRLVRLDQAHDPSVSMPTTVLSFADGGVSAVCDVKTDSEAIAMMKKSGCWDSHKQECEDRFDEAQNWALIMSLVGIYEMWEAVWRHEMLRCVDLSHVDLNHLSGELRLLCSVFGDLRHIRNNFLHGDGYYKKSVPKKLEVIEVSFSQSEKIVFSIDEYNVIKDQLLGALSVFPDGYRIDKAPE